jgi:cellobiose-specific phosphotransferase system component IIC
MGRVAQLGIVIGALGVMLTLMGLFPGVTGLAPTPGVGIVQIFTILTGFTLLILGALIYVKYAYYANRPPNLAQQIGYRLALTGLVLAALAALADHLGFGSHSREFTVDTFLGPLQAAAMIGSFVLACIGVLIYAITGQPQNGNHSKNGPPVDADDT